MVFDTAWGLASLVTARTRAGQRKVNIGSGPTTRGDDMLAPKITNEAQMRTSEGVAS